MILTKAKEALERKVQFPSHEEAFRLYSDICKVCFDIDISPVQIAQVLKAIKIGREKFAHNEDNLVDLCGYSEIENELRKVGSGSGRVILDPSIIAYTTTNYDHVLKEGIKDATM